MNEERHEEPACRPAPTVVLAGAMTGVAVLVGLTVWGRAVSDPATWLLGLDVAIAVVSLGLLPLTLTLRRPVLGTVLLGLLTALSPTATPPATVGALTVARRRRFPVAIAVAAVGVVAHAVQGLWRPAGGLSFAWWLALMVAGYAALVGWGALARSRAALVASLRERAHRAEAEQGRRVAEARRIERTRIAREMHDVLAHRLSLLATYAGAVEYRPDAPPEQLARAAAVIRAGAHQALEELREVITVLRDDETGAPDDARPQPVVADLDRLVNESRDAGATIRLDNDIVDAAAVPDSAGRAVYRVVQEGLTNARKHAAGQPVRVAVHGRPGTQLEVDISNPLGAPAAALAPGAGTGLIGLAERVELAGGALGHEVTAAGDFRLHASIPWPR